MNGRRKCVACGCTFESRNQNPTQQYCSNAACQRVRKSAWQRQKMRSDPDYRENQYRAQTHWRQSNPEYWRDYRRTHSVYTDRNRDLQRLRNHAQIKIAKMDVSDARFRPTSGIYLLACMEKNNKEKMDVWIVQLTVLAGTSSSKAKLQT